jgi:c-di-GMP-binding flagellar brake protein YcgR
MTTPAPVQAAWPELHARVEIWGPWYDVWLPSIIEDRDGTSLTVAVPNQPGSIVPVIGRPGDQMTIHWVSARGAAEVDCHLGEVARNTLVSWHISAIGNPVVRQRRAYVRAEVHLPVTVVDKLGEEPVEGWVVDLSEGGIRLVTTGKELGTGHRALLQIEIEGQEVFVQGEVLRIRPNADGFATVALKFVDLHHRDADRIRRFVFGAQLRTPAGKR